jgi:hypothetical protein
LAQPTTSQNLNVKTSQQHPAVRFFGNLGAGIHNTLRSYNVFDRVENTRDRSLQDLYMEGVMTGDYDEAWGETVRRAEEEPGKLVGEVATEIGVNVATMGAGLAIKGAVTGIKAGKIGAKVYSKSFLSETDRGYERYNLIRNRHAEPAQRFVKKGKVHTINKDSSVSIKRAGISDLTENQLQRITRRFTKNKRTTLGHDTPKVGGGSGELTDTGVGLFAKDKVSSGEYSFIKPIINLKGPQPVGEVKIGTGIEKNFTGDTLIDNVGSNLATSKDTPLVEFSTWGGTYIKIEPKFDKPLKTGIVKELKPNEIFVFGSNPQGRHGRGTAKLAVDKFGAKLGQGEGLQGQSYALPTKKLTGSKMTEAELKSGIDKFITVAKDNPDKEFLMSPIGTGLAGWKPSTITKMFGDDIVQPNLRLPEEFTDILSPAVRGRYFESRTTTNMTGKKSNELVNKLIKKWTKQIDDNPDIKHADEQVTISKDTHSTISRYIDDVDGDSYRQSRSYEAPTNSPSPPTQPMDKDTAIQTIKDQIRLNRQTGVSSYKTTTEDLPNIVEAYVKMNKRHKSNINPKRQSLGTEAPTEDFKPGMNRFVLKFNKDRIVKEVASDSIEYGKYVPKTKDSTVKGLKATRDKFGKNELYAGPPGTASAREWSIIYGTIPRTKTGVSAQALYDSFRTGPKVKGILDDGSWYRGQGPHKSDILKGLPENVEQFRIQRNLTPSEYTKMGMDYMWTDPSSFIRGKAVRGATHPDYDNIDSAARIRALQEVGVIPNRYPQKMPKIEPWDKPLTGKETRRIITGGSKTKIKRTKPRTVKEEVRRNLRSRKYRNVYQGQYIPQYERRQRLKGKKVGTFAELSKLINES